MLAYKLVSGHDHAGHPEENDIGTGDKVGGGIIILHLLVVRLEYAVEQGDRPEPGGEPGIEGIFILTEVGGIDCRILAACKLKGLIGILGDNERTVGEIPCGHTVTPPELTRDTPVANLGHPPAVGVLEFLGDKSHDILLNGFESRLCEGIHLEEPLVGEARLGDGVGVAFGISYLILVVFYFFYKSGFLKIFGNLLAAGETIHANVHSGGFGEGSVVVENVDGFEIVFLTKHVVVHVVGRGNLEATGAEFYIHVVILNHGNLTAYKGHNHALATEMLVLRIGGIDAHGGVAHDCLRTSSSHDCITVLAYNLVAEIVELAVLLFIYNLDVAQGCAGFGVPVYHSLASIDESLTVKVDKYFDYRFGADGVHGEGRALPIA